MFVNSTFEGFRDALPNMPQSFISKMNSISSFATISFKGVETNIIPHDMLMMMKFYQFIWALRNEVPKTICTVHQYNYRDIESAQNTIKKVFQEQYPHSKQYINILYNPTGIIKARVYLQNENILEDNTRMRDIESILTIEDGHIVHFHKVGNSYRCITNRCDYNFVRKILALLPYLNNLEMPEEDLIVFKAYGDLDYDAWLHNLTNCKSLVKYFREQEEVRLTELFKYRKTNAMNKVQGEINTLTRRIQEYENYLANYYNQMNEWHDKLAGLNLSSDGLEQLTELKEYLSKHKYISLLKVEEGYMYFKIIAPALYYDNDFIKKYIKKNTVLDRTSMKVFEKIFIKEEYKLICETDIRISFSNGLCCTKDYDNYTYFPQPHLNFYDCWGNNKPLIIKALAEMDIVQALEQCMAAHFNLNFSDVPVTSRLSQTICDRFKNVKCIQDSEGNLYSFEELNNEEEVINNG